MNLTVRLGKLTLPNPIVCASGTFGFGDELKGLTDYKAIGAVVAKTITLNPREGNAPPRIYETPLGVINSVGLQNPGLEAFVRENLPALRKIPCKKIVSIGGFCDDEYVKCLKRLDKEPGIDAFEINLSCPNVRLKKLVSQSARSTLSLTRKLRRLTKKTLLVKITPEVNDVAEIAKAVEAGGADAVSLVNTYFSMAINIETRRPYLGNIYGGYSGPAIKPMSLYRVWRVAQSVKIPVIGGGGIQDARDAIEFLLAGASAVSLGTVNLVYPNVAQRVIKGIKTYMQRNKIKNIKKLQGALVV
jgi:dihydroorotate dehydrogenase (NAD+) catalytic subunit